MKRITLFTILLIVLAFSCFAATALALAPVKGMMRTHNLLSTDNMYKHLINGNAIGTNSDVVDNAAVALCSIKSSGKNSDDKDCVSLKIEYDGVFASDENPSIVRPYYIYMVEKSSRGNAQSNYDKEKSRLLNTTESPSGDNRSFPSQTAINNNDRGNYLWLDFVLQFPGERGVDGGGVTVDGTYYPLVEGRYSSEVTITATMKGGDTQTITIPLMAIHDTENQGVVDSQVSMNVSPNANAVNLNLDNMLATGTPVSIGKLSFLIRSSVDAVLNSAPVGSQEYADALESMGEITHKLEDAEESKLRSRVETVLQGLGFKMSDMRRPCSEFSGGWQMRIALAKLLLKEPSLLMLDEPTNHLDIESIAWLEDYLGG